jgi:predicted secreted Zn-dependent protease
VRFHPLLLIGFSGLALVLWGCGRTLGVRPLPSLPPNTRVIPTEEHYEVTGNSVEEIHRSMQIGAAQTLGGRATGYHRWQVAWRYQYQEGPGGCAVADLNIDLSSTITLPEWVGGPEADPSLVAYWDEFITNLHHHEYCHRVLAHQQANKSTGSSAEKGGRAAAF